MNIFVLAGGDIRNKFSYIKNNCSCPALIPVNTKPLARYVLDLYLRESQEFVIYLVVDESVVNEVEKELHFLIEHKQVTILPVRNSKGVNETLTQALRAVPETDETIVNIVTTIPEQVPELNEVILDSIKRTKTEWSLIDVDGEEPQFISKSTEGDWKGYSFTGMFRLKTTVLKKAIENVATRNDLLKVVEEANKLVQLSFLQTNMIDCGHETNYYQAKRKLINSRVYNRLYVKPEGGIVKSSTNKEKLKHEVAFPHNLPKDLVHYFPRIIDKGMSDEKTFFYEMEYFGYPNVSELQLYWELSEAKWKILFSKLNQVLKTFRNHQCSISSEQHKQFYWKKTNDRLEKYTTQLSAKNDQFWLRKIITINGEICKPYSELKQFVKESIDHLYKEEDHCVMHGDFCFNNILYDLQNDMVKLIDARGSFGEDNVGVFGDAKYDVAKLLHSSAYGYDYLVNDLFYLKEEGDEYELRFNWRNNHEVFVKMSDKLVENLVMDRWEIKFIVGLLFLSMTPIHLESELRQKAMYLHGLKIINECYNEQ